MILITVDIGDCKTDFYYILYYILYITLLKNCILGTIVGTLFCSTLTLFLPVVSSCWLNSTVGTKEMSILTGLLALQSVFSSKRRSLTYPKSACFQKTSWAASRERALTGQRFRGIIKAKTIVIHQWGVLRLVDWFKLRKVDFTSEMEKVRA